MITTSIFLGYIVSTFLISFLLGYMINGIFSLIKTIR